MKYVMRYLAYVDPLFQLKTLKTNTCVYHHVLNNALPICMGSVQRKSKSNLNDDKLVKDPGVVW